MVNCINVICVPRFIIRNPVFLNTRKSTTQWTWKSKTLNPISLVIFAAKALSASRDLNDTLKIFMAKILQQNSIVINVKAHSSTKRV